MKAVAAAKHHTVIATETGEVFTWGSNRGGCFSDIHIAIFTNCQLSQPANTVVKAYVHDFIRCIKLVMLVGCNLVHRNWYL